MKIAQSSVRMAKMKAYMTNPVTNSKPLLANDKSQIKTDAWATLELVMLARYHMGEVMARYLSMVRMHKLRREAVQHIK